MTVIRGYAETLQEAGLSPEEVRARAELIMANVDRLERMTAETLDFARGSGRLARRPVNLLTLLQELAGSIGAELPGLTVVRDFRVPPGATGALDVDKLQRAVGNIAANALDAMGGEGRLHMSADLKPGGEGAGPRLELVLADEGPGVAAEVRDRLFEPFATFGKKKGTGLGLAVSRRFVEDHGGTLELLPPPPPPERGAAFLISLPLSAPAPTRQAV
jgi:signal transduction histidine kinase